MRPNDDRCFSDSVVANDRRIDPQPQMLDVALVGQRSNDVSRSRSCPIAAMLSRAQIETRTIQQRSRLHSQVFEIKVALEPTKHVVSDDATLMELECRATLGVDHLAADVAVLQKLLLRRAPVLVM